MILDQDLGYPTLWAVRITFMLEIVSLGYNLSFGCEDRLDAVMSIMGPPKSEEDSII